MEKVPPLHYHSFLADLMRDYLDYLDYLGFSIVGPAYDLRRIDRFLVENHIQSFRQCQSRWLAQMVDQYRGQVKATTLRLWRQTFHGLCRYLVRQGWIRENPVTAFPLPKPEPYRPYVFTIEELRRFFDCLQHQAAHASNPLTVYRLRSRYTFYHLLYACGLRVSEAIRLTTADYSAQQGTLFIQPSKFRKDRLIPVGSQVVRHLNDLLDLRQRLFGIPPQGVIFLILPQRRPYHRDWVSDYFRQVLQQLGIYRPERYHQGCYHGPPHLHDLRRAFAIHRLLKWYQQSVDIDAKLPVLATYMGHGCFTYTKTYLTLTQQLLAEAGKRFASRFDRLDWVRDDPQLR